LIKIYLASYLEKENHGPGRKIAISEEKPDSLNLSSAFVPFIPELRIRQGYRSIQLRDQKDAADFFNREYNEQLTKFFDTVNSTDDLPFQDGDTLLSWEREANTNYRRILSKYSTDFGYEVIAK